MQLQYAFFARAVDLTPEGLFSVIGGGIDALNVATPGELVPAGTKIGSLALLVRLECLPEECTVDHNLSVESVAPDGTKSELGKILFKVPNRQDFPDLPTSVTSCVNILNMSFPGKGLYKFRVSVDGEELGFVPLFLHPLGKLGAGE